jgi:purine-binding chemotaxis protein CheW
MIRPAGPRHARPDAQRQGFVSFRLAGQWLGVPVTVAQEVLPAQAVSPVPLAPPEVAGFLNLRGQIVTALDLRVRLGLPPREAGEPTMNIVVRDGEELVSFVVDEVGDVVEVDRGDVEPVPPTLGERWRECCTGVLRLERGLLVVMETRQLLRAPAAHA